MHGRLGSIQLPESVHGCPANNYHHQNGLAKALQDCCMFGKLSGIKLPDCLYDLSLVLRLRPPSFTHLNDSQCALAPRNPSGTLRDDQILGEADLENKGDALPPTFS